MTSTSVRTLPQWLSYLESIHHQEIDMGLARARQVLERLGCQRMAPLVILVGGTNGKGTTSALLSQLLQVQGLSVGVYSSPHIRRYNERITLDGAQITDEDLIQAFCAVEAARGEIPLTYFEFGTLAAFYHFQKVSPDACVLEIGLGGRLDVVNLADADCCVVTSIGLDHQNFLGDTTSAIAYEKCAIARPQRPVICGQVNPPASAKMTCLEQQGIWLQNGDHYHVTEVDDTTISFKSLSPTALNWSLPTPAIPIPNVGTALQALASINRLPDQKVAASVIQDLKVAGRLQTLTLNNRKLTLDVGHNPQAAAYLASRYAQVDGIVLAMLADKDVKGVAAALPDAPSWRLCGLDCPRGLSATELDQLLPDIAHSQCFNTVAEALKSWLEDPATEHQHWLVVGSFYTVEAAQKWLEQV